MELHETIKDLLIRISELPSAEKIIVFGSVAKNAEKPSDLDVALLADECDDWEKLMLVKDHRVTVRELRKLAWENYGLLDPFVVTKSMLAVRNDEATSWMPAKNSKRIKASILKDGIPILSIINNLHLR